MDREIRILHTADTHLGYRQYHSEVRRQDFFKAFETVIQDAVDMQVDAVVHAGDLFDSRNPTLEDLLETMNILSRLKAVDIPFFGIVGNHESKQNTQWLDLFEEMGLAERLGKTPKLVGNTTIYGIDSVPKSKIPLYDYSGFELPDSLPENCKKLLVMHQIVQPFPYADWDCAEVLENLPFKVDAILLGDYHKYEKIKVGEEETWATYSGSTERNSASENEPRSYNIITLSGEGLEISRRTIPTRNFLFITAKIDGEEKPYEQIFSAINEHLEEIPESVVFLDISGNSDSVLSFSEIEEYLLSKGALVSKVKDARIKETLPEEVAKVAFSDPDHAVAEEIRRMSLNDGGLIVDEIIRSPDVVRSRVDEETENRLLRLIETIDFEDPDFRIEIPASPISSTDSIDPVSPINHPVSSADSVSAVSPESSADHVSPDIIENNEKPIPAVEAEKIETLDPAGETEFVAGIAGKTETFRAPVRIKNSESLNEALKKSYEAPDKVREAPDVNPEPPEPLPAFKNIGSPETFGSCETTVSSEVPEKGGERTELEDDAVNKTEKETGKLSGFGVEAGSEKEDADRIEKPAHVPDKAEKPVKQSQRKGKGKSAVPRQYNLGDYL
ncbi:TPA: exonuclease SbcCD subunit D [Methanosarcina acetivorans]|uniref:DNA double-strand break repair protein Mre11 n=2 Tax=Methanosarcina acetivorans TaxID=2214 RepID=MRE11_METAC|nr:exonuclease SbcCD subunit D [Methanosarcina acetivorans]Q8TRL2.1 RecName: Full=DNA double-strand break repair protein Mre11 [Methanosarcina acetivorans C2A]AAM04584.1 DNA repair exonuclease [Methanosarcina acetivorans C2A]HIH93846.1 exonuclease SbcCD subunit D [Methanosarcina acetivorans]